YRPSQFAISRCVPSRGELFPCRRQLTSEVEDLPSTGPVGLHHEAVTGCSFCDPVDRCPFGGDRNGHLVSHLVVIGTANVPAESAGNAFSTFRGLPNPRVCGELCRTHCPHERRWRERRQPDAR